MNVWLMQDRCPLAAALKQRAASSFFCPTYGDEEFEDEFERLLIDFDWTTFAGLPFAFCELGIYTGYEEFGHGLAGTVRGILTKQGLRELVPVLSVDAVPITDWAMIDAWARLIAIRLSEPT